MAVVGVTTGAGVVGISSMNSSATYIVPPFMAIPIPTKAKSGSTRFS